MAGNDIGIKVIIYKKIEKSPGPHLRCIKFTQILPQKSVAIGITHFLEHSNVSKV